jgi:hypothetical protein
LCVAGLLDVEQGERSEQLRQLGVERWADFAVALEQMRQDQFTFLAPILVLDIAQRDQLTPRGLTEAS